MTGMLCESGFFFGDTEPIRREGFPFGFLWHTSGSPRPPSAVARRSNWTTSDLTPFFGSSLIKSKVVHPFNLVLPTRSLLPGCLPLGPNQRCLVESGILEPKDPWLGEFYAIGYRVRNVMRMGSTAYPRERMGQPGSEEGCSLSRRAG